MGARNGSDLIRKWAAAAALVAMVVGGIGVGAFLLIGGGGDRQEASTTTPRPALPPPMPKANEFTVAVVVSGQNCDPAGECVYTYTIEPKYIGFRPLPDNELRVSYQVIGGHQPQDGSFTVHENQARFLQDVTVNGPPGATLTASVIGVAAAPVQGPSVSPNPAQPPPPGG